MQNFQNECIIINYDCSYIGYIQPCGSCFVRNVSKISPRFLIENYYRCRQAVSSFDRSGLFGMRSQKKEKLWNKRKDIT